MLWYAHDQSTSALSPSASCGTHETVICSDNFTKSFPPWMTFTASVTAVMENAQQVPKGCCCWTGPTAPCVRQSIDGLFAAAFSSSSVNVKSCTDCFFRGGGKRGKKIKIKKRIRHSSYTATWHCTADCPRKNATRERSTASKREGGSRSRSRIIYF